VEQTQAQSEQAPAMGRRKQLIGVVVSNKMDKTAVVAVERRMRHPLYRKIIRRTKKYKAHDALNNANLGDIVRLVETRPLSKEKRWRIAEVLTKGDVAEIKPTEIGTTELEEVMPAREAPPVATVQDEGPQEPDAAAETEETEAAEGESEEASER
jgi:small subunit ribosomal protein S17